MLGVVPVDSILTIAGFVIVLVAAVGGGAAYFQQQRAKAIIELQSVQIATQKERIDTLEEQTARQKAEIVELTTNVKVLTETVTQSAKVELLAATSAEQHRAIMVTLEAVARTTERVAKKLDAT